MAEWLWWTGAAYLLIGVAFSVSVERIEGQRMPWRIRAAFVVLWLPATVMGVFDG